MIGDLSGEPLWCPWIFTVLHSCFALPFRGNARLTKGFFFKRLQGYSKKPEGLLHMLIPL